MASISFPSFESFDIVVSEDVTIHGVRSGNGPPLLLLHGFPQTHLIWQRIAPRLTSDHTVILIDLRGYGRSSKPPSTATDPHRAYAKSTMAADCVAVMAALGFPRFQVVGHDRGGRVAHKLCVDHPDTVERVMVLDIAPTLAMFEQTTQAFATAYWHWFFLAQAAPFPEQVILSAPEAFGAKCFGGSAFGAGESVFDRTAVEEYVAQFRDEEGVHGMCEDYRAAATVDLKEAREDKASGRKVKCPLRVLWGKKGSVEGNFDVLKEWKAVCEGEVTGEAVQSGHYIPEELPDVVYTHIRQFFR